LAEQAANDGFSKEVRMTSSDAMPVSAPNTVSSVPSSESPDLDLDGPVTGNAVGDRAKLERRLLFRSEVLQMLQLTEVQVQGLIDTRQIVAIRIAGEERFDSRDLERLIDTYKATALRRAS
jgi:hypothetical protein